MRARSHVAATEGIASRANRERSREWQEAEGDMPDTLHGPMLLRLLLAAACGSIVGYERERVGKPAGVRTHAMVALGSALFTLVGLSPLGGTQDVSRVAAQVVTGVGFLGAGAILHDRRGVHGLTTAASLWVAAALGVSTAAGMYIMSFVTTLIVVVLLHFGPRPGRRDPGEEST